MIPDELLERAFMVSQLADGGDIDSAAEMLTPWVEKDPKMAAKVMLALSDLDQVLRRAHAAYNRGDRSTVVDEMERRYQRDRKARNRSYLELQKRKNDRVA